MWTELVVIVALILVNGVFAGAEIAIVALRTSRLKELADAGSSTARTLIELRGNPERFLSTIQVVITVVGSAAAAFGGSNFAEDLAPLVRLVPVLEPYADQIALGLVVAMISFLSLLLGELVPKSLGLRFSERYSFVVARPLTAMAWLLSGPVWVLTNAANLVLRFFGDKTNFLESRVSLEELRAIVGEAHETGVMPPQAGVIASRAIEFAELTAGDVMVHRSMVVALSKSANADEIKSRMLAGIHQRYPVYEGSIDNVAGYVSWRDIIVRLWDGQPVDLAEALHPTILAPQTQPAPVLLEEMRSRKVHLAVIVDEHGGTAGIVTLEDLLEELVGEIASEGKFAPRDDIVVQPDRSALVAATTAIRDVNRALGVALEEPDQVNTLGGLCVTLAGGRIPKTGERFQAADGSLLEVVDASVRRVRSVRVVRPAPLQPEA